MMNCNTESASRFEENNEFEEEAKFPQQDHLQDGLPALMTKRKGIFQYN
jgi:hypothetical protein